VGIDDDDDDDDDDDLCIDCLGKAICNVTGWPHIYSRISYSLPLARTHARTQQAM
jgi:hypothetical protein